MKLPKRFIVLFAVMTIVPVAVAAMAVGTLGWFTVVILFIILFCCDIMFIVFFTHLFLPVKTITTSAGVIAGGKFSNRIVITLKSSLSDLASSINSLANHIEQKNEQLANKNKVENTSLKHEMQEIASEKTRDDAILDSIGDGLVVTDNMGKILKINATACYILGLNSAQVTGKVLSDAYQIYDEQGNIIPQEKRPVFLALKNHTRISQNIVFISEKKVKKILRVVATPVIENGMRIGGIQTIRDITHEHEVDRMKTEFISLAAHQLRTPLSEIKWLSGLQLSEIAGKLDPEQIKLSKNILNSAERMIDLVNSLLNISRIESGRILIDPHPTDLKQLIQEVMDDVMVKAQERKQKLIIEFSVDVPQVNIDARLIRQVYLNLLTNSIKYSPPEKEITVTVTQDGTNVMSVIRDNGYGIPEKEQYKVFNKFFRAENAVKIQTDGTGLGLYLIKSIIDESGGKIWFKSVEGQGTTFWFSLPLIGTPAKKGEVTLDS